MAGKSLKTLADQLWKNHGITLIPTFDNTISAGSVLSRLHWNNINLIGQLANSSAKDSLPPVEGPKSCLLADFKRSHELNVSAAVSLLQAPAKIGVKLQTVVDVVANFDSPVTYTMDLLRLEDALEGQPDTFWTTALGQRLSTDKRTRIVYQVIRGKISFMFRGSGGVGVDLQADKIPDLGEVGLSTGWKWRNEATLESKQELVIAVDYAWYNWKRKRFQENER